MIFIKTCEQFIRHYCMKICFHKIHQYHKFTKSVPFDVCKTSDDLYAHVYLLWKSRANVQIFSHRIVLYNVLFCTSTATRNHVISVALPGHVGRCNFCPRVCGIYYDFYVCCWVSSFYIILNCMAWNYRTDPFLVFMRSYFEGHF